VQAMGPDAARSAFDDFVENCRREYGGASKVQTGIFGAKMDVALVNDGPVTMTVRIEGTALTPFFVLLVLGYSL
jgi:D-tyrosyl-tRNA(Tyr) deacylase